MKSSATSINGKRGRSFFRVVPEALCYQVSVAKAYAKERRIYIIYIGITSDRANRQSVSIVPSKQKHKACHPESVLNKQNFFKKCQELVNYL